MASYVVPKPTEKPIKIDPAPAVAQIIKQNSLWEYLSLRGSLVSASGKYTGAGVNGDVYVVPAGYVFFLTNATANSFTVADGWNTLYDIDLRYSHAGGGGSGTKLLYYAHYNGLAVSDNPTGASIAPAIPLTFGEKSHFFIYQTLGVNLVTYVTIQGYLIKKEEIPQI